MECVCLRRTIYIAVEWAHMCLHTRIKYFSFHRELNTPLNNFSFVVFVVFVFFIFYFFTRFLFSFASRTDLMDTTHTQTRSVCFAVLTLRGRCALCSLKQKTICSESIKRDRWSEQIVICAYDPIRAIRIIRLCFSSGFFFSLLSNRGDCGKVFLVFN